MTRYNVIKNVFSKDIVIEWFDTREEAQKFVNKQHDSYRYIIREVESGV